jgi:hypothetical protein
MITISLGSQEKECKKFRREELRGQLTNAINLRSSQDQVLWSIFGTFWAANAILLVAFFPNGRLSHDWASTMIVIFGVLLSIIWSFIQHRALGHIEAYEALMEKIEKELGVDYEFAVSLGLNEKLYENHLKKGLSARSVMEISPFVGMFTWFVILGIFLCRIFH